ncbi:uncharacterized protein LOC109545294 [Dendroctonus ponderosae]|uniref:Uncharacterized protein n=1 Tax=Dendroctonus ponderosae TaxID=77166 RepID=U4U0R4_DENPD|nr:uncharacterized protein LOC109545294 [Dendroctonus ponderosae]ERL85858.1 hypothetical protein D910_03273 [Dendroctonus ponderosae]KAH1016910.1 hypothetical protein HUJ04_008062 [Dendroctonus ponderosae]KAH1026322.1 hypothetical protein HUJ05_010860 [Dendroctonus ponderosae]
MYRLAVLLVTLAFVVYGSSVFVSSMDHYIDDCLNPGSNPVALYDKEVREEAEWAHVKQETIRIPEIGFSDGDITCISVLNQENDDVGGYVSIQGGGVGYRYVLLYMESQKSKGFDFRVSVYYTATTTTTSTTTTSSNVYYNQTAT